MWKVRHEETWLLRSTLVFSLIRILSLVLHYLGPSPYGGRLVESADRFLLNAIFVELAVIIGLSAAYYLVALILRFHGKLLRVPYLVCGVSYLFFTQFDLEVVRWLGEHITVSFLKNYFQKSDGEMLGMLLASDLGPTSLSFALVGLGIFAALWLARRPWSGKAGWISLFVLFSVETAFATSPRWFMKSAPRWRRICPVAISISTDFVRQSLGLEKPRNPALAFADLQSYTRNGVLADAPLDTIPEFPLYRETGPGALSPEEFQKLPRDKRPNIVYITFESMRGWETGLVADSTMPSNTPLLDSILQNHAYYFPFTHSMGFPSVEGALNEHMGVWPHYNKIIMSTYVNIRWKSVTEILQDYGYRTEIFASTEPSFDNLTPWYTRWYQYTEYSPRYTQDGPLMDRFIQALDTMDRSKPFFLHTWTVTTHPPFKLPPGIPEPNPSTTETRYDLCAQYTDREIARVIDYLKKSDLWDNTIIVISGDHSSPDLEVRQDQDIAGDFNPGHTWIHLALLGGWPGLPKPQRNERSVPLMDIAPTLLDLLDIGAPNHFMGRSLLDTGSREFLSFRLGNIVQHREDSRLLLEMETENMVYFPLSKSNKKDYALLKGHQMRKALQPPYPFDRDRYRDMIRAYAQLLEEDRIFPREERPRGIYARID